MKWDDYLQVNPLLRVALFVIMGVVAGRALYDHIPAWIWIGLMLACLITCTFFPDRKSFAKYYKEILLQCLLLLMACFFAGASRVCIKESQTRLRLPPYDIEYEAIIISQPIEKEKVMRCDMTITKAENIKVPVTIKAAFLKDDRSKKLKIGDGMICFSQLEEPKNFANSDFDYAEYLKIHGYYASTFLYYTDWHPRKISLSSLSYVERTKIAALKLRQSLIDRLGDMGIGGQDFAVVAAMTLGDKSLLSAETKNTYSISGASHVLALSGLHLGIIYALLSMLFRKRKKMVAGQILIMTGIWAYVVLVGMSASVVRSAIMLSVFSFVSVIGRKNMSVNTLSLAAIIMLIANPLNLYDTGFQMSFGAVLSILLFFQPIYRLIPLSVLDKSKILKWAWNMSAVSIAAQIGVAPLVAHYFGRFSVYFLLTNFIVIPAATVVLYATIFMAALYILPDIQILAAKAIAWFVAQVNHCLMQISSLPYSSIEGIRLSVMQTFIIYILIACMSIFLIYAKKAYHFRKFR